MISDPYFWMKRFLLMLGSEWCVRHLATPASLFQALFHVYQGLMLYSSSCLETPYFPCYVGYLWCWLANIKPIVVKVCCHLLVIEQRPFNCHVVLAVSCARFLAPKQSIIVSVWNHFVAPALTVFCELKCVLGLSSLMSWVLTTSIHLSTKAGFMKLPLKGHSCC